MSDEMTRDPVPRQRIRIRPSSVKAAAKVVRDWHRHLPPPPGALFAASAVARLHDTGWRAEIVRVATDGTYNACSALYGACCRAAQALGYCEIVTKTLPEEGGASLRASGFESLGLTEGGEWGRPSRKRAAAARPEPKMRWRKRLCSGCDACRVAA